MGKGHIKLQYKLSNWECKKWKAQKHLHNHLEVNVPDYFWPQTPCDKAIDYIQTDENYKDKNEDEDCGLLSHPLESEG